jgi:uncharacterized membrane protein required for colicin V production
MVPTIDIILIVILAGFTFYGLFFGFIRTIGSLIGLLAGLWVASHFYLIAFELGQKIFFGYEGIGKIIAFLLIFTLVNRLVVFGFGLLDNAFDIISIIPFLKSINRLAGGIFGFLMGVIILSVIIYFVTGYPIIGGWLIETLSVSKVVPYLEKIVFLVKPFLPEILNKIKSSVNL